MISTAFIRVSKALSKSATAEPQSKISAGLIEASWRTETLKPDDRASRQHEAEMAISAWNATRGQVERVWVLLSVFLASLSLHLLHYFRSHPPTFLAKCVVR